MFDILTDILIKAVVRAGTEVPCSEAKTLDNAPIEEPHINIFDSIRGNGPPFHSK